MSDLDDMLRAIDRLTEGQRETLGWIAINRDGGHSRQRLAALERRGMIESSDEQIPSGIGALMMTVKRYRVLLPWHYAWCEWCSRNVTDEELPPPHPPTTGER